MIEVCQLYRPNTRQEYALLVVDVSDNKITYVTVSRHGVTNTHRLMSIEELCVKFYLLESIPGWAPSEFVAFHIESVKGTTPCNHDLSHS